MWKSSDEVMSVGQKEFADDKRKQDVCGVVHPSIVDHMFRFATEHNLKQIFYNPEKKNK